MKKLISLLLSCMISFTLFSCAVNQENPETQDSLATQGGETATLLAGYGRMCINPNEPAGMAGYGDEETRKSGAVLDDIYATCIALQDGDTTLLVYTIDVCGLSDTHMEAIRAAVTAYTGIPGENIYLGATHTHSAPSMDGNEEWKTQLHAACSIAGKTAIADLAPAKMGATTATLENLNFVRHYLMNDGTYYGSNFGSTASGFKAHALEYPDRQMVLVKLDREEKQDILMVNWQAHPASAAREADYTGISADFVGALRAKVEAQTGMQVAYYTGAAGNTNKDSLIESEKHGLGYVAYGEKIADYVIANLENLTPVENTGIRSTRLSCPVEIDHSWDPLIEQANEVYHVWKTVSKAEADALGKTYGFTSCYQARMIRIRYNRGATENRELRAFRVGPVAFTSGTYEMFSDHAVYVKENSPFDITFVITGCANYIGNKAAFEYRSYETDTGLYASGTGEKLAEEYVRLLNAIH